MKKLLVYKDIGTHNAASNLALNEACLKYVELGNPILRIYTFSEPGLILSNHESMWDVRKPEMATRRNTAGSVIYCDSTTLGYTVIFKPTDLTTDVTHVYRRLTEPIARRLKEKLKGHEVSVGRVFSIRVDGKVLAGHAQYNTKNGIQYDGFVHLEKPDVGKISRHIKLRELASSDGINVICVDGKVFDLKGKLLGEQKSMPTEKLRDEMEELESVHGLKDLGINMEDYCEILRGSFEEAFTATSLEAKKPEKVVLASQQLLESKYLDKKWRESGKKSGFGHCFLEFVEPENGAYPV